MCVILSPRRFITYDGPTAFLVQDILFEPNTYICDSRHKNLIAFQLEVGLLRRVLQAAGAHDADSLEVSALSCRNLCLATDPLVEGQWNSWRNLLKLS